MADDIYESIYSGYQIIVQGAEPIYAPGTGILIGRLKELTAEFAKFTPEIDRLDADGERVIDPFTGASLKAAAIYGNVFDLQAQANEKNWTEEETALVKAKVDYQCQLTPTTVWKRSTAPVVLGPPWPKYDTAHHKSIPALAEQLGLVSESLAYELDNKNRTEVVEKLRASLEGAAVEEALVAE